MTLSSQRGCGDDKTGKTQQMTSLHFWVLIIASAIVLRVRIHSTVQEADQRNRSMKGVRKIVCKTFDALYQLNGKDRSFWSGLKFHKPWRTVAFSPWPFIRWSDASALNFTRVQRIPSIEQSRGIAKGSKPHENFPSPFSCGVLIPYFCNLKVAFEKVAWADVKIIQWST